MIERWKDIVGYELLYQISTLGRVFSKKRGRVLTPAINSRGYCNVILSNISGKKGFVVHRLVAQAYIPNPSAAPQVNHVDGDKTNNNVTNLEWCSQSHNIRHCVSLLKSKGKYINNLLLGNNPKAKRVVNLKTGKQYSCASEVAKEVGLSARALQKRLSGELRNNTEFSYL